jgi:hypothetical protein
MTAMVMASTTHRKRSDASINAAIMESPRLAPQHSHRNRLQEDGSLTDDLLVRFQAAEDFDLTIPSVAHFHRLKRPEIRAWVTASEDEIISADMNDARGRYQHRFSGIGPQTDVGEHPGTEFIVGIVHEEQDAHGAPFERQGGGNPLYRPRKHSSPHADKSCLA